MPEQPTALRVVCVGDSITRGQVSVDYVDLLRKRYATTPWVFVNAGVNYDLAWSVRNRLDGIVAERPDVITVLIGTNDANSTLSRSNRRLAALLRRSNGAPTPERFRDDLAAVVRGLRDRTDARIALLSLPVIGEDLDSTPLHRSTDYSVLVRDIADTQGVDYLPLHERQVEYLRDQGRTPGTHYRPGLMLSSLASIQHFALRRDLDDISAGRGLALTTDTVHQNSRGATMIADLVAEFVTRTSHGDRHRDGRARPAGYLDSSS